MTLKAERTRTRNPAEPERTPAQQVDAHRGLRGDLHAPRRPDGRAGRVAHDPASGGRKLHRPAMGDRRLRPDPRCLHPGLRVGGRPVRPQARVRHGGGGVHGRLASLRHGGERRAPDRGAGATGRRWCGDVRHRAGAHRPGVRGSRAREGDRRLGRDGRVGVRRRPAPRRVRHRRGRLALDLLPQHPHRGRHDRPRAAHRQRLRPGRRSGSTGWGSSRSRARCSCSCWGSCAATTWGGAACRSSRCSSARSR